MLAAPLGCSSANPKASATSEGFLNSPDGAQIHFQVEGSGPDTVVVVHGGPGAGAGAILPDLKPLTRRHVVIYYDQRGGGRSELPADTGRLNAQAFVEDLEALRTHFHLTSLNLVAHSFGSVVVGEYAAKHPTKVARIVLLAATGPSAKQAALFYQRGPVGLDSATAVRQFLALESLMDGTASDPILACRTFEDLGRVAARNRGEFADWKGTSCGMPVAALRYYWRYTARLGPEAFGSWDFTHSLKGIAAPLLVISGGSDTIAMAMDSAWAAALPNARLLRMPSTSRAAYAELPELTFKAIDEFLAGGWPDTTIPAS